MCFQVGEDRNISHTWHGKIEKSCSVCKEPGACVCSRILDPASHTLEQGALKRSGSPPSRPVESFILPPSYHPSLFFLSPSLLSRLGLLPLLLVPVFILAHLGGIYMRAMKRPKKSQGRLCAETVARVTSSAGVQPLSNSTWALGSKLSSPILGL